MKCPHCLESFYENWHTQPFSNDSAGAECWFVAHQRCPACRKMIVELNTKTPASRTALCIPIDSWQVYPRGTARSPLSPEVHEQYASDYEEACLVLSDSPKASAALSRRCLQHIIHERYHIKRRTLSEEIQGLIDSKQLHSDLNQAIDAVRNVGNFAAHPLKDTNTGEIVEVEPGEAEWLLDTLEQLFDFAFVQPARLKQKRDALNQKLAAAGKPPIK